MVLIGTRATAHPLLDATYEGGDGMDVADAVDAQVHDQDRQMHRMQDRIAKADAGEVFDLR